MKRDGSPHGLSEARTRIFLAVGLVSTLLVLLAGPHASAIAPTEAVPATEVISATENDVPWGNQLFVMPRDWLPAGYLRDSDPDSFDPFRFRTGSEFRAKAEAYQTEVLEKRAGIEAAYASLSKSRKTAIEALIDGRRGNHRWIGMPVGTRADAFARAMAVALDGGREAERRGRPEFYHRVIFVLGLDPDSGFEVGEADFGELDRLSRPNGLVPEIEVVVLPLSSLESVANGSGIDGFASAMHFDLETSFVGLPAYRDRFETLLAERFLEQRLLDRLRDDMSEETSRRRPWRDRLGEIRLGTEAWRFAFRDHESEKKLRPLPDGTLDLYRYRYPEILGVRPRTRGAVTWTVKRVSESDAAREYEAVARIPDDHDGGPLLLRLPEYLAYRSAVVHVELRGPGMETARTIEGYRHGPYFVPADLGYRVETKRRETIVHVESIPPGDYRFDVSVVGRRF